MNNIRILAIETSCRTFSAALCENGAVKAELIVDAGLRHAELLKENCLFLFKQTGWTKEQIQGIAVGTGPGSFTGLRVGISFARALAQAMRVPLVGVMSPEIIACGLGAANPRCIITESTGGNVFAGFFKAGRFLPSENYKIISLDLLCAKLARGGQFVCAGDGFLKDEITIRKALGPRLLACEYEQNFPRAGILGKIASERFDWSKLRADSWKKVEPCYLRPPIAVERLRKK